MKLKLKDSAGNEKNVGSVLEAKQTATNKENDVMKVKIRKFDSDKWEEFPEHRIERAKNVGKAWFSVSDPTQRTVTDVHEIIQLPSMMEISFSSEDDIATAFSGNKRYTLIKRLHDKRMERN